MSPVTDGLLRSRGRKRYRYVVFRIQLAATYEHAFAFSKVNACAVDLLQPGVIVMLCEPKEETLYLYVSAIGEKHLKPVRAQVAQPLHEHTRLMVGLALWNLIQQFEDGTFRRRYGEWILPVSPGLLSEAAVLRRRGHRTCREKRRYIAVPEQLSRAVKNEFGIHWNARYPSRKVPIGEKMRFTHTARGDIVAESLQLKRGSAGRRGKVQESVERDHELLPWKGGKAVRTERVGSRRRVQGKAASRA